MRNTLTKRKRLILFSSIILIVCSVFLSNKDLIIKITKKLETSVNLNEVKASRATYKGTVTFYGKPEEAIKSGPTYGSRVKIDLGDRTDKSWNNEFYQIPQVSEYFVLNEGWKIDYVSVAGNSSGNRQPGGLFLLGYSGGAMVYNFIQTPVSKTFRLNYNANGGSVAPARQEATSTQNSCNFTISPQKPTRSGFTFLGWSTSSTAHSPSYHEGGVINVTGTTTLYAVWEKNPTYTVTYTDGVEEEVVFVNQSTEGLEAGDYTPKFEEETGKTQVIEDGTIIPIREGYTFEGWAPAVRNIVSSTDADEKGEIIYTATWQKNPESIINALEITKIASTKTLLVGEEFKYTIKIENPTSEYISVDVSDVLPNSLTFVAATGDGIEKDGIVTWENVTIHGNNSRQLSLTVKANKATTIENTATIHLNNLTKSSNTEIVTPKKPEPTYTVIYKDNDNSFSLQVIRDLEEGRNTPKFKEELGKTEILEDGTIVPIREGYRFVGWSKKINKVVLAEDANENYEIIYVAMWQKMSETTDKEEAITPPKDNNSNEIEVPLTEDKIIKYLISGIVSTLLIIIIISKNKRTVKIN